VRYGWWKSPDFWNLVIPAILIGGVAFFLFWAWFL
jgi:hypothetical protein